MTQLIKDFLEAEKNMFDYCKSFMSFSFLLNTGCLGILLKLYPNLYVIIYILSIGTLLSITSYMVSFKYLNKSTKFIISNDEVKFVSMRRRAYFSSYVGLFFSVLAFEVSLFYYIFNNVSIATQ
jgi:hypothetical protein|nr:MAG TPA: hypothetical protein [Caudoviricetes sp.]